MYQKAASSRGMRSRALQTTAIALAVLVNAPIASAQSAALSGSVAADDAAESATPVPPVAVRQNAPIDFSNKDTIAADSDSGSSVALVSTAGSVKADNSGTIHGSVELLVGNNGDNAPGPLTATLANSGVIGGFAVLKAVDFSGAQTALSAENSGSITNTAPDSSSTVAALLLRREVRGDAPLTSAAFDLHNSGKIDADSDTAGESDSFGVIANGTLGGAATTINNDPTGVISARGKAAVAILSLQGHFTLTNAGTISAISAADQGHFAILSSDGDNSVTNSGTIVGDISLSGGDDVVANWGSIDGDVKPRDGDDIFVEGENSRVTGTIDGGDGIDRFIHARKTTGTVNLLTDLPTNFEYEGVRSLGAGTVVTINAASPLTRGLQLDGDGAIVNTADIQGRVLVAPASDLAGSPLLAGFQNTGKLGGGITGSLRRLDNDGTITAASGLAIDLYQADGVALNNNGTITHGSDDVRAVYAVTSGGEITATNSGSIDGTTTLRTRTSADGGSSPLLVSLSNTGTISATAPTLASTVTIDSSDARGVATSLRVANSGSIQRVGLGTAVLVTASSDPALTAAFKQSFSVENSGVIAADSSKSDDNALVATSTGLLATGNGESTTSVTNTSTGQITANGVRPVAILASGGGFDLDNAGLIQATVATTSRQVPVAITSDAARVSIENKGQIVGDIVLASESSAVTNSGTINGNVSLGAGNALFIAAGGSVNGLIDGGTGTNQFLVSGGTASTPAALTAVQNFQSFVVSQGFATVARRADVGRIELTGGRLVGLSGSTITADDILVGKDATFGSAGVVNANITVAGTLSPGASPGTMVVNGDVALGKGSISLFELGPVSDKLLINGKLSIVPGATLKLVAVGPVRPGRTLELINASNGVIGGFTTIDKAADVPGALVVGSQGLELITLFQAPAGASRAAAGTIDYLNGLLAGGASSQLINAVPKLLTASGEVDAAALARLTPEPYAQATQIGTDDALLLTQAARGAAFAPYGDDAGLFTFGQALGQWHTLRGYAPAGSADSEGQTYGTIGGLGFADHGWVIGAFGGNLTNRQHVVGRGARTRVESLITGIHSRYASEQGFGFSAALAFDGGRARTHRWLPDERQVWSRYKLNSVTSDLSAFYAADVGHGWALTPRAGLTYIRTTRGALNEDGASVFALHVARERHVAGFADGALSFARSERSTEAWRPYVTLGARYQLQGQRVRAVGALDEGDLDLIGVGASRARLVGTAHAGVGYRPSDAIEIFAAAAAQTGRDDHQESITAGVRARL